MNTAGRHPIIVGIDGSPTGDAALDWAVEEAARRHVPVHLVHAREPEVLATDLSGYGPAVDELMDDRAAEAKALLEARVLRAGRSAPGLDITSEVAPDFAAAALVRLSAGADTVVLGRPDGGALAHALLGSVSTQVAHHAHCPVVVVPVESVGSAPRRGVVVGVDGSQGSQLALGYAFEQAGSRDCRLDIVHAWWTRATGGLTGEFREEQKMQQRLALAEFLAGWLEKYPDVEVHRHLPIGRVVPLLVEQGETAELLVVGSRGLGGFGRLLLGSVGHGVLQHARSPVAVVRPDGVPSD